MNVENKYELTDEVKFVYDKGIFRKLYRIRALKDFDECEKERDVKKGDLGGFVESEDNLEHEGECWIFDDAMCYGNGKVYGNGAIFNKVRVYENGEVYKNVDVLESVEVCGDALITGSVEVSGAFIMNSGVIQ